MENESNEMETKPNGESNSILTPKEYLKSLLSKAEIEVVEDIGIMRAILDEGKRVQKMAAKYGTSQDIGGEENFNGFGTYVVSVNEDYIRRHQPEKVIARPFYDTVSDSGCRIEDDPSLVKGSTDRNLRIGDTLRNVDIQTGSLFGHGRDSMHFDSLKVVSASKEGNSVTLMDADRSYIKLPRDTVLSFYKEQQLKEMRKEQRQGRSNKMTLGYV